jgi:hypothetical protein
MKLLIMQTVDGGELITCYHALLGPLILREGICGTHLITRRVCSIFVANATEKGKSRSNRELISCRPAHSQLLYNSILKMEAAVAPPTKFTTCYIPEDHNY